ncbi:MULTISPECIES: hypothetical protein [unclassified Saccharopolyspora]|uniref:hypothetical protein n=1 Tax=unclassified Saccharopolyspora TaxID=2646250 RepID=UPI001CD70577|nr:MULTISPECIES: hypothetical protein [unclassified Saccharopolyspora]MCA1185943.1 hypothetical protein [Saccharopolyspora sp. 6T]MCA1192843.1 hypothetical protein [Saccharopolyspora sp. 6V]MCA1280765.1 hypothetical protein [Saccharopolyspora sp. 7B]
MPKSDGWRCRKKSLNDAVRARLPILVDGFAFGLRALPGKARDAVGRFLSVARCSSSSVGRFGNEDAAGMMELGRWQRVL